MDGVISTSRAWISSGVGGHSRGHLDDEDEDEEEDDIGTAPSQSKASKRVIPLATLHIT